MEQGRVGLLEFNVCAGEIGVLHQLARKKLKLARWTVSELPTPQLEGSIDKLDRMPFVCSGTLDTLDR